MLYVTILTIILYYDMVDLYMLYNSIFIMKILNDY